MLGPTWATAAARHLKWTHNAFDGRTSMTLDNKTSIAISVRNLKLNFGGLVVLSGMSLDVYDGETVGLVGPNGAGKTSLLNCINRVYAQQQGEILLYGAPIDSLRPNQVAGLGLARTFQSTIAFREIKVLDLVLLGRHVRLRPSFASYLIGKPLFDGFERRSREECRRFLEFLDLEDVAEVEVGELPYGTAKLVDLARALALEPRVLLLDEPASGLSSSARERMAGVLNRIRTELRVTQLVVEHDMTLVKRACSRVVVMRDGAKLADGIPSEVLESRDVIEALLGTVLVADNE